MAIMGVVREDRSRSKHPYEKGRTYRFAKDQHGRKWGAECDNRTHDPVSPVQAKFKAPWLPDPKYLRWVYDNDPDSDFVGAYRVEIQYDQMKADRREALKDWQKRLMLAGTQLDGQNFNPENPSLKVMLTVGPKPHPVEVAIAAERGDPWLLGSSPVMPAWARPFFLKLDDDEAAFMREDAPMVDAGDEGPEEEEGEEEDAPAPRRPVRRRKRKRTRATAARKLQPAAVAAGE